MSSFNSTLVRLEADNYDVQTIAAMSFNSTLVRLEDACVLSSGFEAGFQFHFGTIRRITVCPDGQPGALFQFHFGTIRRTILYTLRSSQRSFNSTLVRLEVISLLVMSLL